MCLRPSCPLFNKLFVRHCHSFSKSEDKLVARVASRNVVTNERVKLQLLENNKHVKKFDHPTTNTLPKQAIYGLKEALMSFESSTARQLQHEADQQFERLTQRSIPASPREVQEAREKNLFRNYNWKPIAFKTREQCAAYALATLPMHYAEAKFVLDELDRFNFRPESVLDFGSGAGGVFWAARQKWNDTLKDYSMIDPNEHINHFAMDIMRSKKSGNLIAPFVSFRKSIVASSTKKYDVVIAQRVFSEFDSHESRTNLIRLLWQRTNKYLVLIESHLPDSFKALMHMRAYILLTGLKFDTNAMKSYLAENGLLTAEIIEMLDHKDASLLEKYNFLKRKNLPFTTESDVGHVVAPCPHDSGCPMQTAQDYSSVCSHIVKYKEVRADGKTKSRENDGLIRSPFTYIILNKGQRLAEHSPARILKMSRTTDCVHCKLCTSFEGLQQFSLSKRFKSLYKAVDFMHDGCLFPLREKVVESDSDLHFIREVIDKLKKSV